jgi:hypothetical protein
MGDAQDYDKLTSKQGELLAKIVTVAKEVGGEPMFDYTVYDPEIGISGGGTEFKTDWFGAVGAFEVFEQLGFIVRKKVGASLFQFFLREKAFGYPEWRELPRWQRRLSVAWDSLRADVRGGVITIVASVLASLAVTLLSRLLF